MEENSCFSSRDLKKREEINLFFIHASLRIRTGRRDFSMQSTRESLHLNLYCSSLSKISNAKLCEDTSHLLQFFYTKALPPPLETVWQKIDTTPALSHTSRYYEIKIHIPQSWILVEQRLPASKKILNRARSQEPTLSQ